MSVYPPENGPWDKTVQILTTAFGSFQHKLPLSLLWMGPKKGKGKAWLPNHFVPINPESSGDGDDATDDEKQTEGSACGGCDDDDVLIDDDDDAEVDDDYADYDNNEIDSDTGDDDDDADEEEEETSKVGEDTETHDKTRVCSAGKALPSDDFLPVDMVIDLLTGDTPQKLLVSVPLGTKSNRWFLVENSDNIKRRKVGQKSQYWDDCGAWGNGTKASTPSTVYIRQNGHAMHVVKKRRYILPREAVRWEKNLQG